MITVSFGHLQSIYSLEINFTPERFMYFQNFFFSFIWFESIWNTDVSFAQFYYSNYGSQCFIINNNILIIFKYIFIYRNLFTSQDELLLENHCFVTWIGSNQLEF